MVNGVRSETETVIKKILPYLFRRGYSLEDLDFETPTKNNDRYNLGYVDILVTCGKNKPQFLIEAKRISKKLSTKDRDQAINYAKALGILFVVVTNGVDIHCYNTTNTLPIKWNDKLIDKIPTKSQLSVVISALKSDNNCTSLTLNTDVSLPFRPGLALRQLNSLFSRCHNMIRKIEKDEEHAFSDFSKFLFLKLLEEKSDTSDFSLPYSYRFYELASKSNSESDQVKDAVLKMREEIIKNPTYGEVLRSPIHLENPRTFKAIVEELAAVSFHDSSIDSKGAAFEYFVRATLKGKKLGQYFTPRPLVQVMTSLVGREKIINQILTNKKIKVLDPACGTCGFLVYLMQDCLMQLENKLKNRSINKTTFENLSEKIMKDVFFGSDANAGVACAAKMNMIVAGDGHTNIRHEDSLSKDAKNWSINDPTYDFIFTNPPFGTSESESLNSKDLELFPIRSTKGQHLFLQKMILSTSKNGEICTVIDEGVLNTESVSDLRKWILTNCRICAVVRLPDETFKPNKINVKASLLYLQKFEEPDENEDSDYQVTFIDLLSLGYEGSGDIIRGFDMSKLLDEIQEQSLNNQGKERGGYNWRAFDVNISELRQDKNHRFDLKYWEPNVRKHIHSLNKKSGRTIRELNTITTERGKSPDSDTYVDEKDGYALVIKSGSNISKYGEIVTEDSDWIEKNIYDEFIEKSKLGKNNALVYDGDVLVSSTGDGTLGKSCVFRSKTPAIADGHVTIIRVNPKEIYPEYLSDYLRCGFGAKQIERLFSGSTGMIELTPEALNNVVIDLLSGLDAQKLASQALRKSEQSYNENLLKLDENLKKAVISFAQTN